MAATTFDALKAVRDLEAAGVESRQAEAIARAMRDAADADREDLVTKADIAVLKADVAALEVRMLKFGVGLGFGIVFANVALTVGLLKPL